jgi:exopolyphosphatase/guanosine-5'-triphosphate,3'-diphosphate pyrophosphatase
MTEARFASIDIGSNSVKLLIAERHVNGSFTPISETVYLSRLGEGFHACRLSEPAMRRTLDAVREFARLCMDFNVQGIAAIGTSALRGAANQQDFVYRAAEAGIPIEPISGEEEARLSYLAVRRDPFWIAAPSLYVIDIGGGSTELIHGTGQAEAPDTRISLPLGAVRLTEAALRSDPPTVAQITHATELVDNAFLQLQLAPESFTAVGVGGTLANMGAVKMGLAEKDVDRLHGSVLLAEEVEAQVKLFASRSVEERKQIPGLNPARADIILGGAIILNQALNRLGLTEISISCRGLRWGLLYDRFGR